MKKTVIALAISGFALASVAQAAPQANTFYLGAKAGWASFHDGLSQFDAKYGNEYGVHRNSVTYGVFGGYQITDNFAVEAGYDFYGRAFGREHIKHEKTKHTAHGANLSLKASYPVLETLDVYGRVGAALVRSDYSDYTRGVQGEQTHKLQVSPVFAGGVEYAITPELAVRAEYQWLNNVGKMPKEASFDYRPDVGSVSVGLSYRFGQSQQAEAEMVTKKFSFSSDVLFAFGKAELKPAATESLDNVQAEVAKYGLQSANMEVAGYTDRIGSDAYNQKLSQKRAEAVANYLVSKGVSPEKINAVGYGEQNPVTGNTCDAVKGRKALIACLAPDRRVEVSVQGQQTIVL